MKKIFIAALCILTVSAGCGTEDTGGMDYIPKPVYTLFADVDCQSSVTVDTKSTFDFEGVVWQAGDAFSMFCTGHENVRMILTKVTGSSEGMFAGRSDEPFAEQDTYYAIYPYSASTAFSEDAGISGTFPAEQTDDRPVAVMVAKAQSIADGNPYFEFHKVFAVLELSLTGDGEQVNGLSFKGNSGETVAGDFTVMDFNDPVPQFSGSETEITMTLDEPVTLSASAKKLRIMVPAMTYKNGYTLSIMTATSGNVDAVVKEESVTLVHDAIYPETWQMEVVPVYEWSPGYLTVDENGYRFTDTDREDGTESIGMYFRYNSEYALEADFNDPSAPLKAWYYDEEEGRYASKEVKWSDIPVEDAGDPCARAEVAEGEKKWAMPTKDQWLTWAYWGGGYTAMIEYNQTGERGVYAVYDTDPSKDVVKPMYFFESRLMTTNGGWTKNDWNTMWVASETGLVEGGKVSYIGIKPSAQTNGANPAITEVTVSASLATQGHQIRCIRRVN